MKRARRRKRSRGGEEDLNSIFAAFDCEHVESCDGGQVFVRTALVGRF